MTKKNRFLSVLFGLCLVLNGLFFHGLFFSAPLIAQKAQTPGESENKESTGNPETKERYLDDLIPGEEIDGSLDAEKPAEIPPDEELEPTIFDEARGKALRWKLNQGDLIEIKKDARQIIQFSGGGWNESQARLVQHRVLFDVEEKDPENGYLIAANFRSHFRETAEKGVPFQSDEDHFVRFFIQPRGKFVVERNSFMPSVRDVPFFPEEQDPNAQNHPLEVGDKWSLPGLEVIFDQRKIEIPMDVRYEYLGRQRYKTGDNEIKLLHKIRYNIEINYEVKDAEELGGPKKVFGYSINLLAWDEKQGMPYYEQEEYNMVMIYPDGLTVEWKVYATQTFRKIKRTSPGENLALRRDLEDEMDKMPGAQPEIEKRDEGIAIELSDILFDHDSSKLSHSAREVLERIARTLEKYPDRHLLIRGHTDNTGNDEYNLNLSRERAKTVASFLIERGHLPENNLSYQGIGSQEPKADNDSAEGRQKNRRVEIIILND